MPMTKQRNVRDCSSARQKLLPARLPAWSCSRRLAELSQLNSAFKAAILTHPKTSFSNRREIENFSIASPHSLRLPEPAMDGK
jgi:hypothetical protein